MDCRKLLWLGTVAVGGLVGCSHQDTKSNDPYVSSAPVSGSSGADAKQTARKIDPPKEPSKVLDAKPETCVKLGNLKASLALEKGCPDEDRVLYARQAKDAYKRALDLDPKLVSAYLGMGRLCNWLNEYDQAMHAYDAGLAKQPKQAILWYERGMCLGRQKRFDDALANLTKAAQLEPSHAQYSKAAGLMLARLGRADEALAWLTKSLPEADARYNLARMLEHLGRDQDARTQLQLALKADPNHEAALEMATGEKREVRSSDAVQLASHHPVIDATPTTAPPLVIQIGPSSPLPQRPEPEPATRNEKPARPSPVIPVVSDQWEPKLPAPSSLEGPRSTPKPKPSVEIGFDPNS